MSVTDGNDPKVIADEPQVTQGVDGVQEGTPTEPKDDGSHTEDFKTKYEELRRKSEEDVGKLKSVFQRKESDLAKEKTALERKLDELLQSSMDDEDKKRYQQEKLVEELEQIRQERDELKIQNEQIAQFNTWREYFLDAGVPKSDLKLDGGLPDLFQSGMDALKAKVKALEGKQPVNSTQRKSVEPPDVAQSTAGKPSTILNLRDAIKHFTNGDEEMFWKMAENGNQKVLAVLQELDGNK